MTRFPTPRLLRLWGALAVLAVSTAGPLQAQVPFLNDLFKRAQTLNVNWAFFQHTVHPIGVAPGQLRGFLFELAFNLGASGQRPQEGSTADSVTLSLIDSVMRARGPQGEGGADTLTLGRIDSILSARDQLARAGADSVAVAQIASSVKGPTNRDQIPLKLARIRSILRERRTRGQAASDSMTLVEIDSTLEVRLDTLRRSRTTRWTIAAKPSSEAEAQRWTFEIALGYGKLTGFRSADSSHTLYGSLEEFPVVSLYAALGPFAFPSLRYVPRVFPWQLSIEPYVGVRVGVVSLSGFQAFVTSDTAEKSWAYTATGSTYLLGGILGVEIHLVPRVDLFFEGGITGRRFDGIQWSTTGTNLISDRVPKTIQLTTWGFTLGGQLDLQP